MNPISSSSGHYSGFPRQWLVYFGSGTRGKGIYLSRFDSHSGQLTAPRLVAETVNPNFLALGPGGKFLYAICDNRNELAGAVSAYAVDARTGELKWLNQQPALGTYPCHLAVDATGQSLLVANYGNGSIVALPIHSDGSLGKVATLLQSAGSSINPFRQTGPHAHFILPSPDNRFVLVCDLGLDKVFAFRLDAATARLSAGNPPFTMVAPGSGPRHLVFSADGRFVSLLNEMGNTITVFQFDPASAAMTEVQTLSTLPPEFSGTNITAEIALHPSGDFLYASNRGRDSIALYTVNRQTGQLVFIEDQLTQGQTPRHFTITPDGRWLIVGNLDSDNAVLFAIDPVSGRLKSTGAPISVENPACILLVPADESKVS